jgi:hypothetical protein
MACFHKCFAHETCCGIGVQETGDLSPKRILRSIWNLRLAQSIIQRALSAFYLRVKRPVREADDPPHSTADVKDAGTHTSTRPYAFTAKCLTKLRDIFLFLLT